MKDKRIEDVSSGYPVGGRPGREHPNGWFPGRSTDNDPPADREVIRPSDRKVASNRDEIAQELARRLPDSALRRPDQR